ncbi:sigma 54-interacting transcriptional regulator [bacterium]|nr:sigma 54-interacting transcriptional regulator [bacterium]
MVSKTDLEKENRELHQQLEMFQMIFESINNGALVTDVNGIVTHFNKPYGQFLGINPEEQVGKHCTASVENSRMHIVAKTGVAEINHSHRIKGQSMVVQRIPIKKDGKVIAVFGQVMFKDVKDVSKLAKKLCMLESKVKLYEEELINLRSTRYTFESIIGESDAMIRIKNEALKAAGNKLPVLITGESGTGKELFAQAIHQASPRKVYPFVRINCAAIPRDLLESELFGYERGAFTGARSGGKPGKIELANHGTLFLDEIGDLPLEMQPKLLRVLEEKEFERVGGTSVLKSDFRLIAATNQNLEKAISERLFRKDLFYRLNVIPVKIPPLRDRVEDIIPIVNHLLRQMAAEMAMTDIRLEDEVGRILLNFDWPGNVRELSNVLERTVASTEGDTITCENLPYYLNRLKVRDEPRESSNIKDVQAGAEKKIILSMLETTGFNKTEAAKKLGIHRTLLYKKMKKHAIQYKH